ncbi:MAG TPA: MgtC/SapB family protein [Candidatus Polarisedimenticolia bacterium]|jgi:putative Mg2+ transporter-C (MgtC) family protein|nr:MgtC/SapB family protein [Candidatus Polarisedimenticolia bacterium]
MLESIFGNSGPLLGDFVPKAILAIFCGGLIGVEREIKQKPAGFRTNILICFGSSLVMWLSIHLVAEYAPNRADPGRIAAQVVTGIGFLCAGTILHSRGHITGLTSAAQIWVVSAIGMTIGAGQAGVATFSTSLILLVQLVLGLAEKHLFGRCHMREGEISFDDDHGRTRREIDRIIREQGQAVEPLGLRRADDHHVLTMRYCSLHPQHKGFIGELWMLEGIREVRLAS